MVKIMLIISLCLIVMVLSILLVQHKVATIHTLPNTIIWENIELPTSPNYYLVCSDESCKSKANQESPVYSASLSELKRAWQQLIKEQARVSLLYIDQETEQYWYVQYSKVFHFPDIITVQFVRKSAAESSIILYSRAEYGYQDFGVNKKRCKKWMRALQHNLEK